MRNLLAVFAVALVAVLGVSAVSPAATSYATKSELTTVKQQLNERISALVTRVNTVEAHDASQDPRIASMEAKVAELGKGSGGEEPPAEEPPVEEPPVEPPHEEPTSSCTTTVASLSAALSAVKAGAVVCLADGTYGNLSLSGNGGGGVITAAHPGAVIVGNISATGTNYVVSGLVSGAATCNGSGSQITFDRMDIHGEASAYRAGPCTWKRSEIFAQTGSGEKDSTRCWEGCKGVAWEENLIHVADEDGGHNDGFQTYGGCHGIRYVGNQFVGGLGSQGFFIKDGKCTNVTFSDNLEANRGAGTLGYAGAPFQVYELVPNSADPFYTGHGLVMEHNTIWHNGNTSYFRACGGQDYVVAHNVVDGIRALDDGGSCASSWAAAQVHKSDNIESGAVFRSSSDFRLASGTQGITWDPTSRHYGP